MLRDDVADIISGTFFLSVGFAACVIAASRRRSGVRLLVWLGIWSAMYGFRPLFGSLFELGLLPRWFHAAYPYMHTASLYLVLPVAIRAWLELSRGKTHILLRAILIAALGIALAGFVVFVFGGSKYKLQPYNSLLAACTLLILLVVVAVPQLARKNLLMPNRGVLLVGTLVFALEALYSNVANFLGYSLPGILSDLGFAAFLFSLGYVALQMVSANERRLLSIDSELAVAREIQTSILPSGSPEIKNLRIAAAYRPMTAVAGDFYEFIPIDDWRLGILIADVSGHGVPAALIAGMIKAAMASVVSCARDPGEVLRGLNRILSGRPRDQFVTSAYLYIDTQNRKALYSAAGHPPLLRWREGKLERVESNGLVFGVTPEPDYPVSELPIRAGDRFLVYTDGVIEPENAKGEAFGERRLEQVIRENQTYPPSALVDQLLTEIRLWQPAGAAQPDDITLIVIDVV